jgi:hypothetical protein
MRKMSDAKLRHDALKARLRMRIRRIRRELKVRTEAPAVSSVVVPTTPTLSQGSPPTLPNHTYIDQSVPAGIGEPSRIFSVFVRTLSPLV